MEVGEGERAEGHLPLSLLRAGGRSTPRDFVPSGSSFTTNRFPLPQGTMPPKGPGKGKLPVPLPKDMVLKDTEGKTWRLGSQIGQGGFGLIYLGKNTAGN